MIPRAFPFACTLLALSLVSCGGRSTTPDEGDESGVVPTPTSLFVQGETCPEAAPIGDAEALLASDGPGYPVYVVEVFYASECTGAGGQYLLARTLDGARSFWLGEHGCFFFDDALATTSAGFGVLLASQTAAVFQIAPGICIGFPGASEGVWSDSKVEGLALFSTREDAEAFAATVAAPTP